MFWIIVLPMAVMFFLFLLFIMDNDEEECDAEKTIKQLKAERKTKEFKIVGFYSYNGKYSNSKETYWVNCKLLENGFGQRKLEINTSEATVYGSENPYSQHNKNIDWFKGLNLYNLGLLPWAEGSINNMELSELASDVKFVKKPVIEVTENTSSEGSEIL